MTTPVVVIGAGGFGRETLDVLDAINAKRMAFDVRGVVDDAPSDENLARLQKRGILYLGTLSQWLTSGDRSSYLIGVGDPATRKRIAAACDEAGMPATHAVHPSAGIGSQFTANEGTVICAGAQISTNVRFGRHVHVNPNATVGHDSVLMDFVSVNPAATVSGEVTVHERVLVGAAAMILQGLSVHTDSVVGAAACVVRDVPPSTTVKGVPAV